MQHPVGHFFRKCDGAYVTQGRALGAMRPYRRSHHQAGRRHRAPRTQGGLATAKGEGPGLLLMYATKGSFTDRPTPSARHTNTGRPVPTQSHEPIRTHSGHHVACAALAPRTLIKWDSTQLAGAGLTHAETHHYASPWLARHDANTCESLCGAATSPGG
jgi:hypothetical protein